MTESLVNPRDICPASGLTNAHCMRTICDCFPDEPDRFGVHPERFKVVVTLEEANRLVLEAAERDEQP